MIAILDQFGRDAVMGTLRSHLEDTETEMRRRIKELPDGTTRVAAFMDSSLRENAMQKIQLAITVKGDRLILDFGGTAPQFLNRAVNTNIASFKAALVTGLLQNIWPDLPQPWRCCRPSRSSPTATASSMRKARCRRRMSLMPLFKACVIWTIPMNKLNYSVPHRYSATIARSTDQAATFIYGGLTSTVTSPATSAATSTATARALAATPTASIRCRRCSVSCATRASRKSTRKTRRSSGLAHSGWRKTALALQVPRWPGLRADRHGTRLRHVGFMTGCEGSKFPSAQGLFGGYSCPSYQLMKIKGINIFEILKNDPKAVEVFDIVELMNKQPIKGGKYSSNDMGMTFELCNEGEIYMICQGSAAATATCWSAMPKLVMKDLEERPDVARHRARHLQGRLRREDADRRRRPRRRSCAPTTARSASSAASRSTLSARSG